MNTIHELNHTHGRITGLNLVMATLTLQGFFRDKTFEVASDALVVTATRSAVTLNHLQPGDQVFVYYQHIGARKIAHRIIQLDTGQAEAVEQPGTLATA